MQEFFKNLSGNLVDFTVYTLIAIVMLVGLVKCIFPMRRLSHIFRRATRSLEMMTIKEGTRPVWQDPLFLGRPMQKQWKRFLMNAEQLDARGLSCDVENYINDEDVLISYANMNVAEAIPGMLTSLGILGTFIGLMRGVTGLDVTNAEATMVSISKMIGGMSFAYGTSIAGLSCSLLFNILNKTSQGNVTGAQDDFIDSFRELVMPTPLDDNVHNICYLEDQASFLRKNAADMSRQLSSGISNSIDRSFIPMSRQMNDFILGQTQGQIEGLNHIVSLFIKRMDDTLGGQLSGLTERLSSFNQSQQLSLDGATEAMRAADNLVKHMNDMQKLNQGVIERFEQYVNELSASQAGNAHLAKSTGETLHALQNMADSIVNSFSKIKQGQRALEEQMEQYANWSSRVLEATEKQSDNVSNQTHVIANEMATSGKMLKESYASFVEDISRGFARSMGMFEENMRDISEALSRQSNKAHQDEAIDINNIIALNDTIKALTTALNEATDKLSLKEKA
ncbi:MAG: hypothetical protein Q4E07_01495 [Eubacteriales bacterium]|nr:hypothetical protein [Eubacteriales bacterium]